MNKSKYLFKSERLGFRNWSKGDLYEMAQISGDKRVMEFFPSTQNEFHTQGFMERMQDAYLEKGYCYFAVDVLETKVFIGFIGLLDQTFEAEFTPCVDIGWRLAVDAWNKGYATEGAKRCLEYGFHDLKLKKIYAVAPVLNEKSIAVMQKIGMIEGNTFIHPLLVDDDRLNTCIYYEIESTSKIDQRNKLETNPFSFKITKADKVIIYRGNQEIMIIKGNTATDFMKLSITGTEQEIQLSLAKITGHYKHGNER